MGMLVEGEWKDVWYDTKSTGGAFKRKAAAFRNHVEAGGRFAPEAGRYHLLVADACPWCHRVVLARELMGLTDVISINRVEPLMLEKGWTLKEPDPVTGARYAYEVYTLAQPDYTGRATVPILWDRKEKTIVSNESSELIRMLDDAFRPLHTREVRPWYPEHLRAEIDAFNAWIYTDINNGVYKSGFATTQACLLYTSPSPRD